MKRLIPMILALLLLAACGGKAAPSSQGGPSSGGGLVISQPSEDAESAPPSEPDPDPEVPSDSAPEGQRNETVEALLRDYRSPSQNKPSLADAKPNGFDLYFLDGTSTHLPIPSSGPGLLQTYAASLRNDAVVVAYDPEDGSDTISILSTVDQGQSWQSASLEVSDAGKYNRFYLAFRDAENGILILRQRISDEEPAFADDADLILSTGDSGITWSVPAFFPAPEAIHTITANKDGFTIAGESGHSPVILQSRDGADWNEIVLPLDANQYLQGYCVYAAFSGDTGLAVVFGRTADEDVTPLYFSTGDGGQSWSLYQS